MEIGFDFRLEESGLLGSVLRPIAEVILVSENKELLESAYVDSGADISLIPKSVGDALGWMIDKSDNVVELRGIGERGIPMIIRKVKMRIGEKEFETRVAWALIETVPLLIGRADVFNLFDISFNKNTKTVFKLDD